MKDYEEYVEGVPEHFGESFGKGREKRLRAQGSGLRAQG